MLQRNKACKVRAYLTLLQARPPSLSPGMSEQSVRPASRPFDLESALPWLVAAAVGLLLVALAPRLLPDPDTYSHIALGRWILAHWTVPSTDPISGTMRGAPWIAFEWLSEVAFAGAFAVGSWPGVIALTVFAAGLAFALLTQALAREWQPVPVGIGLVVGLELVSPHMLARPHVLAMPLMVGWIASLIRSNDEKRPPDWRLLPLMTLWANLHGSFTFGLAMLAPLAMEAAYNCKRGERVRVLRQWAVFALLALAAASLNPYGPTMVVGMFRTVALGDALNLILEWRPQDFSHIEPYEIILLAAAAAALFYGVTLPPMRILMLLGLVHLSLAQVRHADLLGLLAPLLLARPFAQQFAALAAVRPARSLGWLSPAPVLLALVLAAAVNLQPAIAPARTITPEQAVRAADLREAGPILNEYAFGGYLEFAGIAPFIDGRGELYGAHYLTRYRNALDLRNVADFERLLDEYQIRTTLLLPHTPAVGLLDRLPGWRRVYTDNVAVVHQRVSASAP